MLNIKNQNVVYGVLSCIFAVILILEMIICGTIIDILYLVIVSLLILKYFIEIKRK